MTSILTDHDAFIFRFANKIHNYTLNDQGEIIELSFRWQNLRKCPEEIGKINSLQSLDLSSNGLSRLPKSFSQLKNLTSLNLNGNRFSKLPDELNSLNRLKYLNLSRNFFIRVPELIKNLSHLEILDLSVNQIKKIPDWITTMPNLKILSFHKNRIKLFPLRVWESHIEFFILSNNDINSMNFTQLGNYKRNFPLNLDFTHNPITYKSFRQAQNIIPPMTHMIFNDFRIDFIPKQISTIKYKGHNLQMSQFRVLFDLPKNIDISSDEYGNITVLNLSNQSLTNLPESVRNLDALIKINLSNNSLLTIPEELIYLPNLLELNLSYNSIQRLPDYTRLLNVKKFILDNNPLSSLFPFTKEQIAMFIDQFTVNHSLNKRKVEESFPNLPERVVKLMIRRDIDEIYLFYEQDIGVIINQLVKYNIKLSKLQQRRLLTELNGKERIFLLNSLDKDHPFRKLITDFDRIQIKDDFFIYL
ncbi:MAG: leucine-rich repeat domain-containing protein [Promethearchaeota archaeon]